MSEPKAFASLSPTLLARKGGARPAMRPQWQSLGTYSTEVPLPPPPMPGSEDALEDLGWNDMGDGEIDGGNLVAFGMGEGPLEGAFSNGPPEVVRQQDSLADRFGESEADEEAPERTETSLIPLAKHRFTRKPAASARDAAVERRSALADGRRAAFTLRVDEARHLKLRLACTVQGRSAQQIVTEALDRLLDELPGLDDLAQRARRR